MNYSIQNYQHHLLIDNLTKIFGEFDSKMLEIIEPQMEWIEILSGQILFNQHDEGDCLYFVISGRLRAYIETHEGHQKIIGEIIRGETVGEMAIFTDEKRSASIIAIRDSTLVKLSKEVFKQVLQAYPLVSLNVTKIIISRLKQSQNPRTVIKKPVNICLLAISESVDIQVFSQNLVKSLTAKVKVLFLNSEQVNKLYGSENIAQTDKQDAKNYQQLSRWLEEQEANYQIIIYVADSTATQWTKRCIRQSDEILLVGDATQKPVISEIELDLLGKNHQTGVQQTLILLHDKETHAPSKTDKWLHHRKMIKNHYHIRPELPTDMARLARIISRTANGLVLAGGGAKGFAHLGVFKALHEFNIPIDFVGGTSAGAFMSSILSFDLSPERAKNTAKMGAASNPASGDYNVFPFISLLTGKKINNIIDTTLREIAYQDVSIEDTWLPLYIVSSNYTKACEEVHTEGKLSKFLRASGAIPGVFPPIIHNGDLLVDGGTFNNFPTDVMNNLGIGNVIGVDLRIGKVHNLTLEKIPNTWELIRDKFRPKRKRKYRLPSLISIILNTTILYSTARHFQTRQCTDLCFNPDVRKFGILETKSFNKIYDTGYNHAKEILSAMTEKELERFRNV